ncbi:hypothetical protein LMG28614_03488 [Paraburkholderia ultramafica]|uniref:Luciferase-like domain-containing protein n=1 Tax=Paraburkholderia ultramafica TaxID=1544867 RepID=A0A6S7B928_9BURK|nr:hypothetical protein LMG28614_03488 [Paraburkholderia ultramafica]
MKESKAGNGKRAAANTQRITLVSGAIVLTLRHPLHIAKAALSVNMLSHGARHAARAIAA